MFVPSLSSKTGLLKSCMLLLALPSTPTKIDEMKPSEKFSLMKETSQYTPMLVEADNWQQPRLSSVAVVWGITSELDLRSNFLRRIGSIRFTLMFLYLLIREFSYCYIL